jgi:lipopolysaccharide transport system permease protein
MNTLEVPITRIVPSRGWIGLKLRDLWMHRELMFFFTWRDLKVRYKQTALGAAWAIIQPASTMIVFSLFFGRLAKVPSDGVPYPVFSYAALVPWMFFAQAMNTASNSLLENSNLLKKVYFPRLAIPVSAILSGLVDFSVAFSTLLLLMAYYGITPTANIIYVPLFLLLAIATALGVGLWISALNVQYRDFRYVMPFLTQFWMFATPVAYSTTLLSEPWRSIFGLNPMAGVVTGFRWALLGAGREPGGAILISSVAAALILIGGAYYFRRMEKTFADLV